VTKALVYVFHGLLILSVKQIETVDGTIENDSGSVAAVGKTNAFLQFGFGLIYLTDK